LVVVEADGFGGATTSVVLGNFPLDYFAEYAKSFETEQEAERAAEQIADEQIADEQQSPAEVLGGAASPVN
jgi:hypothetical protein